MSRPCWRRAIRRREGAPVALLAGVPDRWFVSTDVTAVGAACTTPRDSGRVVPNGGILIFPKDAVGLSSVMVGIPNIGFSLILSGGVTLHSGTSLFRVVALDFQVAGLRFGAVVVDFSFAAVDPTMVLMWDFS